MNNVWKKNYEELGKKLPNEIATEYCNQLYEITNKRVMAKVDIYNVNFDDMNTTTTVFDSIKSNVLFNMGNVQDFLGETDGNDKFTYELFITGATTSKYKYRFCFIEYGITMYPLKIAMDRDIAVELEKSEIVECKNQKEYSEQLISILNSQKLTSVIEGLMAVNKSTE